MKQRLADRQECPNSTSEAHCCRTEARPFARLDKEVGPSRWVRVSKSSQEQSLWRGAVFQLAVSVGEGKL